MLINTVSQVPSLRKVETRITLCKSLFAKKFVGESEEVLKSPYAALKWNVLLWGRW